MSRPRRQAPVLLLAALLLAGTVGPGDADLGVGLSELGQDTPGQDATRKTVPARPDTFLAWEDLDRKNLEGKVVLLNFWATYCPPCLTEIPDLVKVADTFVDQPFVVLGVSLDPGQPVQLQRLLRRFTDRHKINYPVVLDPKFTLAHAYGGILAIPTTLLLDGEGRVRKTYVGARPYARFAADIRALLEKP